MKYERYILPVLLVLELLFHLAGALLKSRREVCVFVFNLVGGTPIELCGKTLGVPNFFLQTYVLGGPRKTLETNFGRCKPKPASSKDLHGTVSSGKLFFQSTLF